MEPSDINTRVSYASPPATEEPAGQDIGPSGVGASVLCGAEHRVVIGLLGALLIVAGVGTLTTVDSPVALTVGSSDESVGLRMDPNFAPWWELTVIPGIGETTARGIVSFRSENGGGVDAVFRSPADLQSVHGIGPKTSARMAPYWLFPDS